MPIETAGLPFSRLSVSAFAAPSSTRATSRTRSTEPSGLARMHDVAELLRRGQPPLGLHVDLELRRRRWSAARRRARPRACTFCAWIAAMMSVGARFEADQPVDVEPDAHRVVERAEHDAPGRRPARAPAASSTLMVT